MSVGVELPQNHIYTEDITAMLSGLAVSPCRVPSERRNIPNPEVSHHTAAYRPRRCLLHNAESSVLPCGAEGICDWGAKVSAYGHTSSEGEGRKRCPPAHYSKKKWFLVFPNISYIPCKRTCWSAGSPEGLMSDVEKPPIRMRTN